MVPDLLINQLRNELRNINGRLDTLDARSNWGKWVDYTPTFTSAFGAASVGAGSVVGRYCRIGDLCVCETLVAFGTGFTVGLGAYRIGTPFAREIPLRAAVLVSTPYIMGTHRFYDEGSASGMAYLSGAIMTAGTSYFEMYYQSTWPSGTETFVGGSSPQPRATTTTTRIASTVIFEAKRV